MTYCIRPFSLGDAAQWDGFIDQSRNGTFLHKRRFMDYHADRFQDASVVAVDERRSIVAVFPANVVGDRVVSHGGLTYGGLILSPRTGQADCIELMTAIAEHFRRAGMKSMLYKAVPVIFQPRPAEDDLYALFRLGADLVRRDASTVVDLRGGYRFSKGRKWSIGKARKAGVAVARRSDPARFHALLCDVLHKHAATPVHSVAELALLMERFPDNIALYEAGLGGQLVAAALLFDFGATVHTQYLAASELSRELGALDLLVAHLMQEVYAGRSYFSFGISTTEGGLALNEGLIQQKESFGGSTVVHDFYEVTL